VDFRANLPVKTPQSPITKRILNTADPTIVPVPTSPFAMNTPGVEWKKNTFHDNS